jgi:hypothetical protein
MEVQLVIRSYRDHDLSDHATSFHSFNAIRIGQSACQGGTPAAVSEMIDYWFTGSARPFRAAASTKTELSYGRCSEKWPGCVRDRCGRGRGRYPAVTVTFWARARRLHPL